MIASFTSFETHILHTYVTNKIPQPYIEYIFINYHRGYCKIKYYFKYHKEKNHIYFKFTKKSILNELYLIFRWKKSFRNP